MPQRAQGQDGPRAIRSSCSLRRWAMRMKRPEPEPERGRPETEEVPRTFPVATSRASRLAVRRPRPPPFEDCFREGREGKVPAPHSGQRVRKSGFARTPGPGEARELPPSSGLANLQTGLNVPSPACRERGTGRCPSGWRSDYRLPSVVGPNRPSPGHSPCPTASRWYRPSSNSEAKRRANSSPSSFVCRSHPNDNRSNRQESTLPGGNKLFFS